MESYREKTKKGGHVGYPQEGKGLTENQTWYAQEIPGSRKNLGLHVSLIEVSGRQ